MKHHIDTSIILEDPTTYDGRICARYLNKIKFTEEGVISLPVLGELMLSIIKIEDYNDRMDIQEMIVHLVDIHKIRIFVSKNTSEIINKMLAIDSRIDPTDSHILASAIEDGANCLITLDRKLIGNKKLEQEFEIRISHPSDVL